MAKSTLFSKNRILSRLSAGDKALLEPDLEPVTLTLRQVSRSPQQAHHTLLFHKLWAGVDHRLQQPQTARSGADRL